MWILRPQRPAPRPPAPPPVVPGLKRALFVGINYVWTPYELAGCINDAKDMQKQVQTFFPGCKDTRLITDETPMKPTKANILSSLDWLVSGLRAGEHVLFHYSGHGGLVRDKNGDEVSGMDSSLYALNGQTLESILDDDIRERLATKVPAGCKCFVVLDCCHSGTAVDLRCLWEATAPDRLSYREDQKYPKTAGTVVFLSGCRDTQTAADTVSAEGRPCGALTMALLKTWQTYGRAIKFKYLLWDVRKYLRENGYTQIPQLSTGAFYDTNTVFDLGK